MTTREIHGDAAERRVRKYVDDTTALEAIPSARVAPGTICVLKDAQAVALYDNESTTTASADRVHVPDDIEASAAYIADPTTAPGRWHIFGSAALVALTDAAIGLTKRTVTVTHADLTTATNGTSEAEDIGATLPANARIIGVDMRSLTPFTGGGATAVTVDIGTSGDIDAIVDGADVFAAAVDGGPATMPAGVRPNKTFATAGAQLIATFTPDGSHTLDGLTAGSVVIDVLFSALA